MMVNLSRRFMYTYDDKTMEPIAPQLGPGEKLHVLCTHDECYVHVNECARRQWLASGQQPLRKKGNGHGIHISDWILETHGRLVLNASEIAAQAALPLESRLRVQDAHKIIYPGKNADKWWDLPQLMDQLQDAIDIFEVIHPDAVGIWVFDCSSAHEGLAPDALNVNRMNVNPGGKQTLMRDTTIPLSNPEPKPGRFDTRGLQQSLVYPQNHHDPALAGKAKGMKAVVQERVSVWDRLVEEVGSEKKALGKCESCRTSQVKKDAERRVAMAEAAGQEESIQDADLEAAEGPVVENKSKWCCLYRVLSLQEDFVNEKPMIQHYIEGRGHICMFYPKFHCEFNAIKMLWGYGKYRKLSHLLFCIKLNGIQVFVWPPMESLRRQRFWSRSVLTWLIFLRFGDSFGSRGGTWMLIGMCVLLIDTQLLTWSTQKGSRCSPS